VDAPGAVDSPRSPANPLDRGGRKPTATRSWRSKSPA